MVVIHICALSILFQGIVCSDATNFELSVSPEELVVLPESRNITLDCYGNVKDIGYYLTHKVTWRRLSHSNKTINITTGLSLNALMEASYLFDHGHLDNNTTRYTFRLTLKSVTYLDDGWYICEKTNPDRSLGAMKSIQVTVMRPVESVKLTIHLDNHVNISSNKISTDKQAFMEIEEGNYMVSCTASGSNPEPIISLTFGEKRQDDVGINFTKVIRDGMRSYQGRSNGHIFFEWDESAKYLICEVVVAKTSFPSHMAGIRIKVIPPTVHISCGNVSALVGYKETSLECQITTNETVHCEHVNWKENLKNLYVGSSMRLKHRVYGIVFTTCQSLNKTQLLTRLIIYDVMEVHFEKYFCVEYLKEKRMYQQSVLLLRKEPHRTRVAMVTREIFHKKLCMKVDVLNQLNDQGGRDCCCSILMSNILQYRKQRT